MKKLAIGCAVLVLVCLVAGAVGSYFVYHKVRSTIAGFAELRKVPELDRSVRNHSPYVPPRTGEMSPSQLQRYLTVAQTVRTRLGAQATEFERTYHRLLAKKEATAVDMPELAAAYRDLAGVYMDGKRAQVDALNKAGFSLRGVPLGADPKLRGARSADDGLRCYEDDRGRAGRSHSHAAGAHDSARAHRPTGQSEAGQALREGDRGLRPVRIFRSLTPRSAAAIRGPLGQPLPARLIRRRRRCPSVPSSATR